MDSYALGRAWQERVRPAAPLLVWDDFGASETFCADLILNQNAHADAATYTGRAKDAALLMGTGYGRARREFAPYGAFRGRPRPSRGGCW